MSFLDVCRACPYVTSPQIITLNIVAILVLLVAPAVFPTSGRTSYEGAGLFGEFTGVLTTCREEEVQCRERWDMERCKGRGSGGEPGTVPLPATWLPLGLTGARTVPPPPLRLRSFPLDRHL